jgi:hypothetical protein
LSPSRFGTKRNAKLTPGATLRAMSVTGYEARRAAHADLIAATDSLIAEFAGVVSAGTVLRQVALAREHLLAAGVRAGLAAAAEAMARTRLVALAVPHGVAG